MSRSSAGLTWHDGAIPSNEIWVKLGGDKGRGSFKGAGTPPTHPPTQTH